MLLAQFDGVKYAEHEIRRRAFGWDRKTFWMTEIVLALIDM